MGHTREPRGGGGGVVRHTRRCRSPPHERMSEVTPSDGDLPHRGR
jgi:hypothetical protein